MREQEYSPNENENTPVDGFGLTKERRFETVNTNIDLMLRRCKRQGIQPREMMLRSINDSEEINTRFGEMAHDIYERVKAISDFDLENTESHSQASEELQSIFSMLIEQQFSGNEREVQARKHWQQVGIFSYELGENHELVLHIPPMTDSPQLNQMKDSLKQLSELIEKDQDIKEIKGSSLLLEHPLAKRLGFEIDTESDEGFNPNFRMSREKFLELFSK